MKKILVLAVVLHLHLIEAFSKHDFPKVESLGAITKERGRIKICNKDFLLSKSFHGKYILRQNPLKYLLQSHCHWSLKIQSRQWAKLTIFIILST